MTAAPATWVEVDLAALERNFDEVTRLAGPRRVIGAIKANGYGFGAVDIARALERCGAYGLWTGNVEEAIAARNAGVAGKIIMFGGYLPEHIDDLVHNDLIPTIYDRNGLAAAAQVAESRGRIVPVYIKVDSGLRRLGVPVAAAQEFARAVSDEPRIHLEGIYTHLPFADPTGRGWANDNYALFHDLLNNLARDGIHPDITQVWGSSGLLAGLSDSTNAVCIGQLLYGLAPLPSNAASATNFTPIVTALKARLIHVGQHHGGQAAISSPYVLGRAERTGVIALGTADGMRSSAIGQPMYVLVRGRPAPIIGVTLEHTVVSLNAIHEAEPGDEVILIGQSDQQSVSLADWASWFDCSPLEVAVSLLGRVAKHYENAQLTL
ncbi:Alanine racemase [Rhodococcus wratislaviensis]|uniref:Alanine racemase n=1 Tax=Rhodococcus wratislaviensis TaxID=44752 RepID=A0A402C2X8_RHOWR|nr:alanine racemase [Rhodococcus wratislaviensis]GCE37911.1 Alanine racemase [Rhodococcus wratislaviensis]